MISLYNYQSALIKLLGFILFTQTCAVLMHIYMNYQVHMSHLYFIGLEKCYISVVTHVHGLPVFYFHDVMDRKYRFNDL